MFKTFKKFSVFVFVVLVLIIASTGISRGEEQEDNSSGQLVATINIYDAKLVSQENNKFNISFDISNREGVQTDVKYSALLIDSSGSVIDQKVFDDSLNFSGSQTIHRNVSYIVPSSISGDYKLWVESRNSKGLSLGLTYITDVKISSDATEYVKILTSDCYLSVRGEATATKYSIEQGVDIDPKETILLNCPLQSKLSADTKFSTSFVTRTGTAFGDAVSTDDKNTIVLVKNGNQNLSLELPKAKNPQAYDISFNLISLDKTLSSNNVKVHYVLQGESGSIQNVIFNKTSYLAGEMARAKIFWSGSADNFLGARIKQASAVNNVVIDIKMFDSKGLVCGEKKNYSIAANQVLFIVDIPVANDCDQPEVGIVLSSKTDSGKQIILDSNNIKVKSDIQENNEISREDEQMAIVVGSIAFATIVVLLAIAILLIVIKLKNFRASKVIILIIAGITGFSMSSDKVLADTYVYKVEHVHLTYTVNMNKAAYTPDEDVGVSGSMEGTACHNWLYNAGINNVKIGSAGTGQVLLGLVDSSNAHNAFNIASYGHVTLKAPASSGKYMLFATDYAAFENGKGAAISSTRKIPFVVGGYVITAKTKNIGGNIDPSGLVGVVDGASQKFNFSFNPGFKINELIVDGATQDIETSYTFDNVVEDHSIEVGFGRNRAPSTPEITGPTIGEAGNLYSFNFKSVDPDGDKIKYLVQWNGDIFHGGQFTSVPSEGYVDSDTTEIGSYLWGKSGKKIIGVKAVDEFGMESGIARFNINLTETRTFTPNLYVRESGTREYSSERDGTFEFESDVPVKVDLKYDIDFAGVDSNRNYSCNLYIDDASKTLVYVPGVNSGEYYRGVIDNVIQDPDITRTYVYECENKSTLETKKTTATVVVRSSLVDPCADGSCGGGGGGVDDPMSCSSPKVFDVTNNACICPSDKYITIGTEPNTTCRAIGGTTIER